VVCVHRFDQIIEGVNVPAAVVLFKGVEPSVASIFGMADDVKNEVHLFEEIGFYEVVGESHSIFVLARTVVHYNGEFFPCAFLSHYAEPLKLVH
jgi:hypothetical protein